MVLLKFLSYTGLPAQIQSNSSTKFMGRLIHQLLTMFDVLLMFHPESQGEVERFRQSMKRLLRCCCLYIGTNWVQTIPFVLFAAGAAKQVTLEFTLI